MEAIEETVVVAVPVSRAYTAWTEFQSLPVYLSSPESAVQFGPCRVKIRGGAAWRSTFVGRPVRADP